MRRALALLLTLCLANLPLLEASAAPFGAQPSPQAEDYAYELFSPEQLDNLLAPIALYPDPLLSQVLVAATFVDDVDEAARWVRAYGTNGVDDQTWDVSVKAVAHYPTVIAMMADKIDWTTSLGQAYVNQSTDVMMSVQRLRHMARNVGNLVTTPQQQVLIEDDYISIVPYGPEYIYVPVYDPYICYYRRPAWGLAITFGVGFLIGAWLNRDCDWHHHRIYYHGWNGPGWIDRSRPHVRISSIYVNNRYDNVIVNRNVIQRNVNVNNIDRYRAVHRDVNYNNIRDNNVRLNQRNNVRVDQRPARPPVNNRIINRNIDTSNPRLDQYRGREAAPRPGRPAQAPPAQPPAGEASRGATSGGSAPGAASGRTPGSTATGAACSRAPGSAHPCSSRRAPGSCPGPCSSARATRLWQDGRQFRSARIESTGTVQPATDEPAPLRPSARSASSRTEQACACARAARRRKEETMKIIMGTVTRYAEGNREMNAPALKFDLAALLTLIFFLAVSFLGVAPAAHAQAPAQSTYSSPDDAMQALVTAAKSKDRSALAAIFGPDYEQLLSGDDVEDANDLDDFAEAVGESAQLQKAGDSKYTMVVGKNNYPMPIPIVQKDGKWLFDTKAGLDEVLNRRIGENELSAINTCRAYAIAQWEYFTEGDWDNDGVAEYAQKFISTPGEHNGLYWETAEGEKPSPLGQLVAAARQEGYGPMPRKPAASDQAANPAPEPAIRKGSACPPAGPLLWLLLQNPEEPGAPRARRKIRLYH